MSRPWQQVNPGLLTDVIDDVRSAYPTLHFVEDHGRVRVKGSFPLIHAGRVLDRYKLLVELPLDYPLSLPTVWDIGGRIPRVADRHVNATDGALCICLPDAQLAANPAGTTLLDFLNGPVRNYLIGNSLVELGDRWPFGEWQHGALGIREFYGELLGTCELSAISQYLTYLGRPSLKGHWECPCGSRRKLRDCHIAVVRGLRERIPMSVARHALAALSSEEMKQRRGRG